jgi:hypothetical protein
MGSGGSSSVNSGSMGLRRTRRLPRNNLRLMIRPNTRTSVACYKAVEAAYFDGPHRSLHHVDNNQGYRCVNERKERTMHE